MIGAIQTLGNLILQDKEKQCDVAPSNQLAFLMSLARNRISARYEGAEIIRLVFPLKGKRIRLETLKALSDDRLQYYLWIGNAAGNKPQNRLTTNILRYLFSQTIPNITGALEIWQEKDSDVQNFENILRTVLERYFERLRSGRKGTVIKGSAIGIDSTSLDIESVVTAFLEKNQLPQKNIFTLFTISIEEKGKVLDLVQHPGYLKYMERVFLRFHETQPGVCHFCNSRTSVLSNPDFPSGSPLKVYVVDKGGFLSGVENSDAARRKTLTICPNCLRQLYVGNAYIEQTLRLSSGPFNVYLIPQLFKRKMYTADIDVWCENLKRIFGAINSFEDLSEFQKELQNHPEIQPDDMYALHILFGQAAQSKFDYKRLIQDVPVSRLQTIHKKEQHWEKCARQWFGDAEGLKTWHLGFREIARLFPTRVRKGTPSEWASLIELYSSILLATRYPIENLIQRGVLLARIHRYGNYTGYYLEKPKMKDPGIPLVLDMVKFNLLIRLLRDIDVLVVESMTEKMHHQVLNGIFDDKVMEWLRLMEYDSEQQALFLLGVLVAKIGSEQYNRGDRKKAILDKIRFHGMDFDRVRTLANRILEYLRMYRLMNGENEVIFGVMMTLLNEHASTWNKSDDENVFYILSGYSFMTMSIITKLKE